MTGDRDQSTPRWLWLWFPPAMLLTQYGTRWLAPALHDRYIQPELGLIELATPALLLPAIWYGARAVRAGARMPRPWLRLWFLALTLGCIYFAGEELSWGQQLFGWRTPDAIARLNDQGETNLHNMSSWLDQKPRALLKAFVLVGGVLLPLWRWRRGAAGTPAAGTTGLAWPPAIVLPTAVLALALSVPPNLEKHFGLVTPFPFDIRESETIEYYYALFLLIYLRDAAIRLARPVQ